MPALRHGHPLLPPSCHKTSPHLGSNLIYRSSHFSSLPAPREGEREQSGYLGAAGIRRELCGIAGWLRSPDRDLTFNRKEKRDTK